jgi:hypothetical protein
MHLPFHPAKNFQEKTAKVLHQNNLPTPEEVQRVLCAAGSLAAMAAMHVVITAVGEVKAMASELVQVLIHDPV